jgi:DNA-binding LacI/PurR family transcriptional regulator
VSPCVRGPYPSSKRRAKPQSGGAGGVKRRSRITSTDVAREAGVSRTTVSYVLNGVSQRGISASTATRVREAAARLGYLPSAAARSLRRGHSELVLVVVGDWPYSYAVSQVIEHLTRQLAPRGLTVLVHHRTRDSPPITELCWTVDAAAVISLEGVSDREEETLQAAGIHVTHPRTAAATDHPGILVAASPDIGRLQVEHLAAAGHRRIAYALPDDPTLAVFAVPRLGGARAACERLGLTTPHEQQVPLNPSGAAAAVAAFRSLDDPVTAVCAYNDDVALAVLAGMAAHQLTAPTDLAVIGVDNIPTAALASPPLTTVDFHPAAIGRHLAAIVLGEQDETPHLPAVPILVVRESA